MSRIIQLIAIYSFVVCSGLVNADERVSMEFDLEFGTQVDDVLTINEIEKTEAVGDSATLIDASISGSFRPFGFLNFVGTTRVNRLRYDEYQEFDQQLAMHQIGVEVNVWGFDFGVTQVMADVDLNEQSFLALQQQHFSVSRLVFDHFYLSARRIDGDSDFAENTERNHSKRQNQLSAYAFFNEAKSYFSFSSSTIRSRADDDRFNSNGFELELAFSHSFESFSNEQNIRVFTKRKRQDFRRYFVEDSASIPVDDAFENPSVSARNDRVDSVGFALTSTLNTYLSLVARYETIDATSNLESMDYETNVVNLGVKATF